MNNFQNMQNQNFNSSSQFEQKKNDKKGIFYGVVAVATLVVAIIGATFAYFTASARSSEGALQATAAHVQVNYTQGKQIVATNLIPASPAVVTKAYYQDSAYEKNIKNGCTYSGAVSGTTETDPESNTISSSWSCPENVAPVSTGNANTKCVDDNGYYVCFVYQFDVTNTSNVSQNLSAYLTILQNTFTTVDEATLKGMGTITQTAADSATDENRALKFMTVRSSKIIDTEVTKDAEKCEQNLYTGHKTSQSHESTRFCKSNGDSDVTTSGGTFTADYTNPLAVSTESQFSDADHTFYYFYFNTTAERQSLRAPKKATPEDTELTPESQYAFMNETIPSVAAADTNVSNGLLYMHTLSSVENQDYVVGTAGNNRTLTEVWANGYGESYESESECISRSGTRYITADANKSFLSTKTGQQKLANTCERVYLSTESEEVKGGSDADDAPSSIDRIKGVYGQVRKTFYIVAWLEESNPEDDYTDSTTGTNIHQDKDQDAKFRATINVTSGSEDTTGITGTIAVDPRS